MYSTARKLSVLCIILVAVNIVGTFLTALGLERCRELVDELTNTAIQSLKGFEQPEFLIWLAEEMARRGN